MDFLTRVRAFPPAPSPNDDPSAIKGNVTMEEKRLSANILAYHVAHHPGSRVFGHKETKGLKLAEMWVRTVGMGSVGVELSEAERGGRRQALEGQTICEITVDEDMLNVHGGLAGGCAAHFVDIATFTSLFTLSFVTGIDVSGVSTSLNLAWHAPARLGTELKIVSTTLSIGSRVSAARCEVYDKKTTRLLISGTHLIVPVATLSSNKASRKVDKATQAKL